MAAASVCSTAIYQGTDQGGVRMKRHRVLIRLAFIKVGEMKLDFIDLFHVTFHIKSNAALISRHVLALNQSCVVILSKTISPHSKRETCFSLGFELNWKSATSSEPQEPLARS